MVNMEVRAHKQASVVVSRAPNVLCNLVQGRQDMRGGRSMAMDPYTLPDSRGAVPLGTPLPDPLTGTRQTSDRSGAALSPRSFATCHSHTPCFRAPCYALFRTQLRTYPETSSKPSCHQSAALIERGGFL